MKLIVWFKSLFCKHEFNGSYNISVKRKVVEMDCHKCNKKHSWTFAQWQKTNSKKAGLIACFIFKKWN